jgi:magnesium-transporting ATPase (P-type)
MENERSYESKNTQTHNTPNFSVSNPLKIYILQLLHFFYQTITPWDSEGFNSISNFQIFHQFFSYFSFFGFSSMASDGFTDKNLVFRKLKMKSENKVLNFEFWCIVFLFVFLVIVIVIFELEFLFALFELWDQVLDLWLWFICFWFLNMWCDGFCFRCVLIVIRRIQHGLLLRMGSFYALIALLFIEVSVFILASWGKLLIDFHKCWIFWLFLF